MKKLLLTITVITLAFTLLGTINVFALTEGDWEFQLLDNEAKITKYVGTDVNIVVPDTLYGVPVTEMDEDTFNNIRSDVVSVKFPSHVKTITEKILYYAESLKSVTVPEGVEIIETMAFSDCHSLETVNLPSTLEEIYMGAFLGCRSLKYIDIPAGLEYLGGAVFQDSGVVSVDISHINPEYDKYGQFFANCSNLVDVKLNSNIPVIYRHMFTGCGSLQEIDIPASVTEIRENAFYNCVALKSVVLPVNLKTIEKYAFFNCDSLKEVVVPYGVESIGDASFQRCDNLKSLFLPDTISSMSDYLLLESNNAIIYCTAESNVAKMCKNAQISYLTDNSVNTGIHVFYNGTRISFHSYGQNPELLNSRTLVPLRSIFEAMGATVTWDDATSTATSTRDGVTVSIQIGANEMYKNGESVPVDVPAQLMNDRTMVPVRVIAEAFGAEVLWNGNGNAVFINE